MQHEINDEKPHQVVACVEFFGLKSSRKKMDKNPTVLALGLTFKADVNDLRESPALEIAHSACSTKMTSLFLLCEPHVETTVVQSLINKPHVSLNDGIEAADIIVCLVHHTLFKELDRTTLQSKKILDFCGLFYHSHVETDQQEQLFWPANSLTSQTPFDPQLTQALNSFKEQCS